MRLLSVVAVLAQVAIAHADPPTTAAKQIAHRTKPDVALRGITFELPPARARTPLSQRRILRTRGDGPAALLSRSSNRRWFVGVPGVQRLTKLQSSHAGVGLTVIGARF